MNISANTTTDGDTRLAATELDCPEARPATHAAASDRQGAGDSFAPLYALPPMPRIPSRKFFKH